MIKNHYLEILPRIKPNEWKFMVSVTRAWTLRDVARISGLSVSTVHRILQKFYEKGSLYFLLDLKKANLLLLALIFPKLDIKEVPPFTVSIREVYNIGTYTLITALVPPPLVEKYIGWFNKEPVLVIRGYEYLRWRPDGGLSKYSAQFERVLPIFNFEVVRKRYSYPVERWSRGFTAPDIYDLILIHGRMRNPLARPMEIYKEVKARDPCLPKISEQLLSYHFTRHVKSMWKGNTAIVFSSMELVPVRIFYFEGKDAPIFARILCQLPGAYTARIDVNKSLVIGQFPCKYDEYILREAETFEIEMPFKYFVQSSTDMRKIIPWLWKCIEGRKWVFREELRIPIQTRKVKSLPVLSSYK